MGFHKASKRIHNFLQVTKDSRSNSFHELSTSEAAEFARQNGESSSAFPGTDEVNHSQQDQPSFDNHIGSPIVEIQSSVSLVHLGKEDAETPVDDGSVSLLHEIQWLKGGKKVFVRGTFSDWEKIPMTGMDKGSFAYTFPIEKGQTYSYNFLVDGEVCCDKDREVKEYLVGEVEENVNTFCVRDWSI